MDRYKFLVLVLAVYFTTLPIQAKVITCYHGTWSHYRPGNGTFEIEDIDPFLCTHVIYTFVGIHENGTVKLLDDWLDLGLKGFERFNGLKTQNPNLKTLLAVGGWNEGSQKYSDAVAANDTRANFVNSALDLVLTYGFDGFDLDWEYPNQGGDRGGVPADVQNFVLLIQELKAAFQPHNLLLTAAVGAARNRTDTSYDVPGLSKYLDFIHVMTYDYRSAADAPNGLAHHSPLFPSAVDNTTELKQLNVFDSITYWLGKGADPQKLVLGLPFYGRTFTLANPNKTHIGDNFTGPGLAGPYTGEAGTLGYNEICEQIQAGNLTVVRDWRQHVPYAYGGDQWVGYDDPISIVKKVLLAKLLNLGGVMLWSIETDDFRGLCGDKYPLLKAINSVL